MYMPFLCVIIKQKIWEKMTLQNDYATSQGHATIFKQ